ncbi:hypothetical protein F5B21DRAFT_521070 [Xylaria acuta]|nr:hypothetical protein F5B21DRAFT_521070 [Xylaria acuta]
MPKRPGEPFTITRPRNKRQRVSSEPFTAILHIQPWLGQDSHSGECEQTVELTIHENFEFAYDELNTPDPNRETGEVTEVEEEQEDDSGGDGEGCEDDDWEQSWPTAPESSSDLDFEAGEMTDVNEDAGDGEGFETENRGQPSLIVLHVLQEEQEGTRNNSRAVRITTWRTRQRGLGPVEELQPDWEWFIGTPNLGSDLGSEASETIDAQGEQAYGAGESEGIEAGMLLTYGGKSRRSPITTRRNAGGVHVDIPELSQLTQQEGLDSPRQVWENRILEIIIVLLAIAIVITFRYTLEALYD